MFRSRQVLMVSINCSFHQVLSNQWSPVGPPEAENPKNPMRTSSLAAFACKSALGHVDTNVTTNARILDTTMPTTPARVEQKA